MTLLKQILLELLIIQATVGVTVSVIESEWNVCGIIRLT
jgi:hypothetical protein